MATESWFGKIIGGSVGFMLGGPLGAIAGAAIGHGLDSMSEEGVRLGAGATGLNTHESSQYIFFLTTFSLLAKMARADGVVRREEVAAVEQFMATNLRLSGGARDLAIRIFNEAKDSPHSFESLAQQFRALFANDTQMLAVMYEILFRVATSDGDLHPAEKELLERAETIFGISTEDARRVRASFVNDGGESAEFTSAERGRVAPSGIDRFYEVLGCSPQNSMEEIRSKYRALAREYHPDKIVSKGLPQEFMALATKRVQEFNEAYEAIQKARKV